MNKDSAHLIENLNHDDINVRLDSLRRLMDKINSGELPRPSTWKRCNNHIHTLPGLSLTPTKAVWMAIRQAWQPPALWIMIPRRCKRVYRRGKNCRNSHHHRNRMPGRLSNTPITGRRINNPDQDSVVYMALHGVPHTQIERWMNTSSPIVICVTAATVKWLKE